MLVSRAGVQHALTGQLSMVRCAVFLHGELSTQFVVSTTRTLTSTKVSVVHVVRVNELQILSLARSCFVGTVNLFANLSK